MSGHIEVFTGQSTDVEARVYAVLHLPALDGGDQSITMSGTLVGPYCDIARTLPGSFSFRDLGSNPKPLAGAIVPDPSFWSPPLPHLYKVEVTAQCGGREVAAYKGLFGIRRFGTQGNSFVLDGRRWVVRGAIRANVGDLTRSAWHPLRHAQLVPDPEDGVCKSASREGKPIIADLPVDEGGGDELTSALYRLARWPAVILAVVPTPVYKSRPKNLLLAQWFGVKEEVQPATWADVVMCEVANADEAVERLAGCELPVIAVRSGGPFKSVGEISTACDRLQRDLAPQLDLAGYIV